ncbi:unnamed protein product [Clonostachys rhizophaga]|uniref:Uncharacterized protein n=1 Tax=Clonostachys rhizophaga TaxID=160324 RepID=A0A9N9VFS3_9HYPO|nr:unnamed protein product [Clonostachys rhizophaga]
MPSRTNSTAPFSRDSEDTHNAFLADEDESNSSIEQSHYNELPENTQFFQDAIASGQEPAATFPEEVQEPRVDHSDTRPRLVPFPSRSIASQDLPDAFRPGYFDNAAAMPNPYRFPAGAPTQPAERPALWDDTSSSTPPFPTVSPSATSFAARASRLSPHHMRTVDFSPSPPSPSCLAYSSTARVVRGNNPYQRGAYTAQMLSNIRLSAGAAAAAAIGPDYLMPLLEGDMIDALRRERERNRTYTGGDGAERADRLRMNVGPGAHSVRRRRLAHRPRRPFGSLNTCFDNMVHENLATVGGETSQEAAAQNLALREAQRFLHECIDQRRARREAQQQDEEDTEDEEEGQEPDSTTDGEHEDEDDEEY